MSDLEFLCNVRQEACLRQLTVLINELCVSITHQQHDDMFSIDLRTCVEICSEFTGDQLTEELLDGIFSRFCVGK